MGTRGIFGFRLNNEDKLTYNHFDSYPDGLGTDVVKFINRVKNWNKIRERVATLEDVSDRKPTRRDVYDLEKFTNLNVGQNSTKDWYCLLRETQGNPRIILDVGKFECANDFIYDSLFCEYGYIINLDENTLEIYKGFQKAPHDCGRYSDRKPNQDGYYPCKLVATFKLCDIPMDWINK